MLKNTFFFLSLASLKMLASFLFFPPTIPMCGISLSTTKTLCYGWEGPPPCIYGQTDRPRDISCSNLTDCGVLLHRLTAIRVTTSTTEWGMQLSCRQENNLLYRRLQVCVLLGFYSGIYLINPQLYLYWSFHPSCLKIVTGSHLLCSTFRVLVLYISILYF